MADGVEMAVDGRRVAAHRRNPDRGPRCEHLGSTEIIGWPEPGRLREHKGAMASTYVCARQDCQADAAAWAYVVTGHLPVRSPLPGSTS